LSTRAATVGLLPAVVRPLTLRVMEEIGLPLTGQYSKPLTDYIGKVHFS